MNPAVVIVGVGAVLWLGFGLMFGRKKKKPRSVPTPAPSTESAERLISSPFEGVSDEQWTVFVKGSKWGDKDTNTPTNLYGWFLFTQEDLKDFADIQSFDNKTIGGFLLSSQMQYDAFLRMTKNHRDYILSNPLIRGTIGNNFDGETITLSGLLGLSHQLGLRGLMNWISKGENRTPETVTAFQATNGVF